MPFRFSGHETFPCRYAWLPKAHAAVVEDCMAFADDEAAMIRLGVGKNMVRAVRFWMQAALVASPLAKGGGYKATAFGDALLREGGLDPYLEDIRTLWLIHWNISTHVEEPLFAWDFLLNNWSNPDLTRSAALVAFRKEAARQERQLSEVTLEQHFDTFLHTYVPTRSRKAEIQEDTLDCPLVELELLQKIGERAPDGDGRREAIYAFRREEKPEITSALFAYCLADFSQKRRASERTLTFKDVAFGHGSPGQVLKLPEWDIRQRLENIADETNGYFRYTESAAMQRVLIEEGPPPNFLEAIYEGGVRC
ncbi:MAG: DUF4007 family protein [Gemmataceae bacterium]|nr:DUF4007 family protein [Gemmataceae bacterium]